MRRLLCLMLAVLAAASAQAVSTGARWVDGIGLVADNDRRWATFNDLILIGGYASPDALICRSYTTETTMTTVWTTNQWRQGVPVTMNLPSTNWGEIFVLTNYPYARKYRVGEGLNPHFAAMKMWPVKVDLAYASPIVDPSMLPLPSTNTLVSPMVSPTVPLYDCGVPVVVPPDTNRSGAIKPPDTGNGEYGKGMDYLAEGDFNTALKWFIKAARKGHSEAKEQLRTNAHPAFVESRGSGNTIIPPPAPPTSEPLSSNTNKDGPPPQTPPDETPPATNVPPTATPAANGDAATLTKLEAANAANAALEKRVAELERQPPKHPPSETQPKTSSGNWRWLWVVGILVVLSALWLFNASRGREE
jgi:hypothetical protein